MAGKYQNHQSSNAVSFYCAQLLYDGRHLYRVSFKGHHHHCHPPTPLKNTNWKICHPGEMTHAQKHIALLWGTRSDSVWIMWWIIGFLLRVAWFMAGKANTDQITKSFIILRNSLLRTLIWRILEQRMSRSSATQVSTLHGIWGGPWSILKVQSKVCQRTEKEMAWAKAWQKKHRSTPTTLGE